MNDKSGIEPPSLSEKSPCYFFNFGLIVTGETEELHLPKLFKSLMKSGICYFRVIRRIGQRSPITSEKKRLEMVGKGKKVSKIDEDEIGFPARRYLASDENKIILLIDDLEHDRRNIAKQVFDRYRLVLDTILTNEQKCRVAIHFLVPMLEAYYFADAKSINSVLKLESPLDDYDGDVESKRNPKADLKRLYPEFNEKDDGGKILDCIDVEHVLSHPDTCASLRTIMKWCIKNMECYPNFESLSLSDSYCLQDGKLYEVTKKQIDFIST